MKPQPVEVRVELAGGKSLPFLTGELAQQDYAPPSCRKGKGTMKPQPVEVSVELAGGKRLSFETGKLAKQAHGSAVVRMGDSVVLATATANADPREGIDFFPLTEI